MAQKKLPTVWPIQPHTLAKHAILTRYLNAWFVILARQSARVGENDRRILYIDGFAGPGAYTGGEDGSPVLALRAAMSHRAEFPKPISFLFVENDAARVAHLSMLVSDLEPDWRTSGNVADVAVLHGDCDAVLRSKIKGYEARGATFGPALAFLDQFGYADVPIELVAELLRFPQCEVFSYLECQGMNRWISDPTKAEAFRRTFGGDEWKAAIGHSESRQREILLRAYIEALRLRAGAKYVQAFTMFDANARPLYWLIFCTQSLRGLEEMKKAMWSVDSTGEFRFSDREDPSQLQLLSRAYDDEWLADEIASRLASRIVSVRDVWEHVLVETPCCRHKGALSILETKRSPAGVTPIDPPARRRKGKFADERMLLKFADRGLF